MTRPLRITFILPHAGLAGGIRVVAIYAERLQQRGHLVQVISTPWVPPGRRGRAWSRIRRVLHTMNPLVHGPLDPSHLDGVNVPHRRIRHGGGVRDAEVPDGDVVVATWWETANWVAALSPSKGAKAYFIQDYGAHEGQAMTDIVATWRLPMHRIAISQWIISLLRDHAGVDPATVAYVPNAVDHEQFHAAPRGKQQQPSVGFVYNPVAQKGCDIMIEAVRLARLTMPNLRVIAYGPGNPGPPLPPGTKYHHMAPNSALAGIYSSCDAWLFASRKEGFGLPIQEAMACRTPVIATPAGAAPELLAGGGGVMVEHENPRAMADAILRVIGLSNDEWVQMSSAALATVAGYTWDDATRLFEAALHRACERQASATITAA